MHSFKLFFFPVWHHTAPWPASGGRREAPPIVIHRQPNKQHLIKNSKEKHEKKKHVRHHRSSSPRLEHPFIRETLVRHSVVHSAKIYLHPSPAAKQSVGLLSLVRCSASVTGATHTHTSAPPVHYKMSVTGMKIFFSLSVQVAP